MRKHVKVVKEDGKMLEFSSPIHVKDILINFPTNAAIVDSKNATETLSQDHELKGGKLYYLIPHNKEAEEQGGGGTKTKRIKVLITKQQLQQLVTKEMSLQELLSIVKTDGVSLTCDRKPILDSIPEENE